MIAQTGENGLSLKIDTTGFYLNGEIFLSDVDDEGRLYIYESNEPGNRVIGIYELKFVDKG